MRVLECKNCSRAVSFHKLMCDSMYEVELEGIHDLDSEISPI